MIGFRALCAGVILLAAMPAMAYTGNDLRTWGADRKKDTFYGGMYMGYITGVRDSFAIEGYCPPKQMTNGQAESVIWKWLSANPERWAESGSDLIIVALLNAFPCRKSP